MKETRKKLQLPAAPAEKRRKKTAVLLAVLILFAALSAGALLLTFNRTISSTRAVFGAAILEIQLKLDGRVAYAAAPGQPVRFGEAVLKMDAAPYELEAQEAEKALKAKAGHLAEGSGNLMLRYLAIVRSEAELAEAIKTAQSAEKSSRAAHAGLLERQAVFSLELRKRELRQKPLPEEQKRIEAMRLEETLFRKRVKESQAEYESASLKRAALEKQLQDKRDLGRALRALPTEQREQLQALDSEFRRMSKAQEQIALATVETPKSGKVVYAAICGGDMARAGDTALYIVPEDENGLWVRAYFSAADAIRVKLGQPCSVIFGSSVASLTIQGLVSERLPYLVNEQPDTPPFKITLNNVDLAAIGGINPRQSLRVIIDK